MQYSYPLTIDPYKILYPMPQERSHLLALLRPYDKAVIDQFLVQVAFRLILKQVWILFFVTLAITVLFLAVSSNFLFEWNVENFMWNDLGRIFIYAMATNLSQGNWNKRPYNL
jgi:hypothetical protein